MRPNRKLALVALLVLGISTVHAASSEAQRRYYGRRVIVGGYFGYPFYDPFFYDPFFIGYPWAGPYYWQAYPPRWDGRPRERTIGVKTDISPKETQIYVDGYFSGTADDFDGLFSRLRLAPGQHDVVLYLKGYRTVHQTIDLRGNSDYKIKEKMVPLGAGETSEPPPTPPTPPPSATRERERDREGQPAMPPEPGEGRRRLPRDRREAPPAEARGFGSVAIRVQPAGADVLVDGERWQGPEGMGPLVVQLAAGPHRVEVTKDGYVGYSTEIDVREGETTRLNVSLPERR